MNTYKLLTLSTASLIVALFMNACGNSETTTTVSSSSSTSSVLTQVSSSSIETIASSKSSSSSSSAEALVAQERIEITTCSDVSDDSLVKIEVGDVLMNEELNTSIKLIHNEDDIKFVCTESGSAYLLR